MNFISHHVTICCSVIEISSHKCLGFLRLCMDKNHTWFVYI